MDAATLVKAQPGLSSSRADALIAGCNAAMDLGEINTVGRCAMFMAQIGEESVSLRYQQEIGNDSYLQSRPYWPYIGRTFIQVTWDYNYRAFGAWMHEKRPDLLSDPNYFVNNPSALAGDQWAWYGPVWYWTTHGLNDYADRGDIYGATVKINGGTNGLADRTSRWNHCLTLGAALLPVSADPLEEIMSYYASKADFEAALAKIVAAQNKKVIDAVVTKIHDYFTGHNIRTVLSAYFQGFTGGPAKDYSKIAELDPPPKKK